MESNLNRLGIADTSQGKRLVQVEYEDNLGFFFVTDVETKAKSRVFRHYINFFPMIPSRFKETHFAAVAHIWGIMLDNYPSDLLAETKEFSHETLCRKLREAREAKKRYGYKHPKINEANWERLAYKISVEVTNNGVLLASKDKKKQEKENKEAVVSLIPNNKKVVINVTADFAKIEHLCLLLSERVFNPSPVFVLASITDEQIISLEGRYDVAFVKENDQWVII